MGVNFSGRVSGVNDFLLEGLVNGLDWVAITGARRQWIARPLSPSFLLFFHLWFNPLLRYVEEIWKTISAVWILNGKDDFVLCSPRVGLKVYVLLFLWLITCFFFSPALCVELWYLGKAENQVPSDSRWEDANNTVRHSCTVSSGPDTLPRCTRDTTFNLWSN